VNLNERFQVMRSRDDVVEILCRDETLLDLLPEGDTQIVSSEGDHRTTETRYTALGREGVATFDFTFLMDGGIRFSKVCDGNVWKKLEGLVSVEEIDDRSCEVTIELSGRTKALVPEFAIKGPMEDQIQEMTLALEEKLSR
jgi:hypothetical protein